METMMGVKQSLEPELEAELGLIQSTAPHYSLWIKIKLIASIIDRGKTRS